MAASKRLAWIVGTVMAALLILAGAWFLTIGPNMDATAQAQEDTETTLQQNDVQRAKLATLKEQFAELDTFRAQLADIQTLIPVEDGLPSLLRELQGRADAAGLTITGVTSAVPVPFFAAAPVETAPADGEEQDVATDGTAAVGVSGLYAISLQVTVVGSKEAAFAFVAGVQEQISRLYAVHGFVSERQDTAESTNGKPATVEGDVEMIIDGYVYVLDPDIAAPAADGGATAGEETS